MKKNLLAVLLPVVAGVALSGTGFGLWVFKENVDAKSIGASMELQPAININNDMSVTLSVKNSETSDQAQDETMIFDEEYKTNGSWEVTLSVSITYEQLTGELANYGTSGYQYSPLDTPDSAELSTKLGHYKITVENTISTSLANYVKLNTPATPTLSYTLAQFDSSTSTDPSKPNHIVLSKEYKFKFVPTDAYKSITTPSAYAGLKGAVNNGKITFTASFEEVAHSA
ncbi:MAG: hypothetical protein SPG76_00050 [Candidatus Enterosoma sp.]|nr:hypothetical protein [Candidatus Enterosoma sp.]